MEFWRVVSFFVIGLVWIPLLGGFCCLKIYDGFQEAIEKKNRKQLLLFFSLAVFGVVVAIIFLVGLGMALHEAKLPYFFMPWIRNNV